MALKTNLNDIYKLFKENGSVKFCNFYFLKALQNLDSY